MEGLIFGGAYVWKGNLRLKIDWASLILGRKFTVFLCFPLYLRAISKYKPPAGLIFGGDYFRNFTVYADTGLHGILRNDSIPPDECTLPSSLTLRLK